MDRYFYDTLVDVSDGRHWFWIRLLERSRRPRKCRGSSTSARGIVQPEGRYSVEYLRARWVATGRLPWVRAAVTLPNIAT